MSESVRLMRELYDDHRRGNRRLFDVAATLGADADRDVGTQFSVPTVKGMFAPITEPDLGRIVEFKDTAGTLFRLALGGLLQHVANHATHHRSEIAPMLTMLRGSPPFTDIVVSLRQKTGQAS